MVYVKMLFSITLRSGHGQSLFFGYVRPISHQRREQFSCQCALRFEQTAFHVIQRPACLSDLVQRFSKLDQGFQQLRLRLHQL